MKKLYPIFYLLTSLFLTNNLKAQSLGFTVTPQSQCGYYYLNSAFGIAAVTSTPAGTTSYSWTINSGVGACTSTFVATSIGHMLTNIYFPCPAIYTITCSAYNGATLISTLSQTAEVMPTPTVNIISSSTSICGSSSVTLTASSSSSSYTWYPGGSTASSIIVSPTASSNYSLSALGLNGCYGSTYNLITVAVSAPTINISAPAAGTVCTGSHWITLNGNSTSYTWMPGNIVGGSQLVNLQSNICYTFTGTNACGTSSETLCYSVVPTPTLSVSGTNSYCAGSTVTLNASGATTYSWGAPFNVTTSSLVITPTINQVVTLVGYNNICNSVQNFTLTPSSTASPAITSPGSSFCAGTTITLNATGASNYTWTNGTTLISNSTSIVVTPTANSCYTLIGSGSSSACPGYATKCLTVTNTPNLILTGLGSTVCSNGFYANASGASSYTWMPGNIITSTFWAYLTPQVNTCYTVTGSNSCGTGVAVGCVTVVTAPTLTITGPTNVCAGSTVTLSANGASTTYSWTTPSYATITGSSIVVTPTATCIYSVQSTSQGCYAFTTTTLNIISVPAFTLTGNNPVCAGSSLTLNAFSFGALNYTWNSGSIISTSSLAVVSPTANTCYTVTGQNTAGCQTDNVICVTTYPMPTVSITGSAPICAGANLTLTASGANTYTWSNALTGSAIVLNPAASACYTVTGNSLGCTSTATTCITVMALPTVACASQTVCKGTSTDLTASGASTYSWSTGATTSTIHLLPTTSHNYTVYGTGSNGCTGFNITSVVVDTTCSDVWPGDANNDGVVDNTDVFEIGYAYSNTGAPRSPGGNAYTDQYATNWAGTVSTGKNKCHADCNGDGIVNNGDTLAIYNNYSLTHAFKVSGSASSNPDIYISTDQIYANMGMWNKVDILLGDATNQMNQIYGVAFDLDFDQSLIETNSAYILYTSSFLNMSNQNVEFRKSNFTIGKIYAATVREDGVNVNGNGKIGEFWFKVKMDLADGTDLNIGITNPKKTNKAGVINAITADGTVLIISDVTGIKEINAVKNQIRFFPNPTSNQLTLQSVNALKVAYTICDITGREVIKGEFTNSKTIDLSSCTSGAYIIRFESGSVTSYKKLVIEK